MDFQFHSISSIFGQNIVTRYEKCSKESYYTKFHYKIAIFSQKFTPKPTKLKGVWKKLKPCEQKTQAFWLQNSINR